MTNIKTPEEIIDELWYVYTKFEVNDPDAIQPKWIEIINNALSAERNANLDQIVRQQEEIAECGKCLKARDAKIKELEQQVSSLKAAFKILEDSNG